MTGFGRTRRMPHLRSSPLFMLRIFPLLPSFSHNNDFFRTTRVFLFFKDTTVGTTPTFSTSFPVGNITASFVIIRFILWQLTGIFIRVLRRSARLSCLTAMLPFPQNTFIFRTTLLPSMLLCGRLIWLLQLGIRR
uniref:Uncharacterized protein n=1 Tax=Arundo donax TaxID=35708 RepID=A0A0A9DWH6_ARUDO